MSEQDQPAETGTETPQATHALRAEVKNRIAGLPERLRERLTSELLDEELDRRAGIVREGLDRLKTLEKELKGIKPDAKVRDENGAVIHEGFTESTHKRREEVSKKITKLTKTLDACLSDEVTADHFNQLQKLS